MSNKKNNNNRIITIILFLIFFGFLAWFFFDILIYMFASIVLTLLGTPLMRLLGRIRIKNRHIPKTIAAIITLLAIIGLFILFVYTIFPLIVKEFRTLLDIDPALIIDGVQSLVIKIDNFLKIHGFLEADENFATIVAVRLKGMISTYNISSIFGNVFNMVAAIFIAIFSILFMTFFSLKDEQILFKMIKKIVPNSFKPNFDHILIATKKQLTNYFSGVLIEMVIIGTLEGLICYILGVPNPILIGFVGGLLNIIPYVGALIAGSLSIVIALAGIMPLSPTESMISMTILKVVIAFVTSKLIDDFLLQPSIYAKSVHSHPLEIFIIILVAGNVGGIAGMILAVPVYSLLRIIGREFFEPYFFSRENDGEEEEKTHQPPNQ